MKHEKEWYTCDRCGVIINMSMRNVGTHIPFRRKKIYKHAKLETVIVDKNGYIAKEELMLPDNVVVEIHEYYEENRKTIHLCGKCRKEFERFMGN